MKTLVASEDLSQRQQHNAISSQLSDVLWRIYYENGGPDIMFKGAVQLGARAEERIVPVEDVHFSHDSISPTFGTGEHAGAEVTDLVTALDEAQVDPLDPRLRLHVVVFKGLLFSLNNRRLFALKEHQRTRRPGQTVRVHVQVFALDPITAKFALSCTTTTDGQSVVVR